MEEPLSNPNRVPRYEFIAPHFYCDGIRVQPSQMTPEEIRRFIPRAYWSGYFRSKLPCPFDGCEYLFDRSPNLKRAWTQHVRNAHRQWYADHGKEMQNCADYGEFVTLVEARPIIDKS